MASSEFAATLNGIEQLRFAGQHFVIPAVQHLTNILFLARKGLLLLQAKRETVVGCGRKIFPLLPRQRFKLRFTIVRYRNALDTRTLTYPGESVNEVC